MGRNFKTAAPTSIARILSGLAPLVLGLVASAFSLHASAQNDRPGDAANGDVHVGVLGLFHPQEFTVSAPQGSALLLQAGDQRVVLEKSSGVDSARVSVSEGGLLLVAGTRVVQTSRLAVSGRNHEPVEFVLAVPHKITRRYRGTLEIKRSNANLIAIVTMDCETAVASVVAAESAPDTPLEALKAQAVAARSYIVASHGRHHDFDFCDTTHCQFLREPPPPGSVTRAVAATRDLVLAYDSHPFAALYTRSCSGHTRTPAELGLPSAQYPYYSAECKYCRAHPARWTSRISAQNASALHSSDESARLNVDRSLGWSAVPSNDFTLKKDGDQIILEGTGQGHGIGLCQAGAKAMAVEGADFQQILSHYYPNAKVIGWSSVVGQGGPDQIVRSP